MVCLTEEAIVSDIVSRWLMMYYAPGRHLPMRLTKKSVTSLGNRKVAGGYESNPQSTEYRVLSYHTLVDGGSGDWWR